MRDVNKDLGEALHSTRRKKGYSQGDIAEHLGVSAAAVSSWEKGTRPFPLKYMPKIAELLGDISKEIFISETDDGTERVCDDEVKKIVLEQMRLLQKETQRLLETPTERPSDLTGLSYAISNLASIYAELRRGITCDTSS